MLKKLLIALICILPAVVKGQSTTTLPTPISATTSYTIQSRYTSTAGDTLKQLWFLNGSKYNRMYTATEIQKLYGKSFKAKMDSTLSATNVWSGASNTYLNTILSGDNSSGNYGYFSGNSFGLISTSGSLNLTPGSISVTGGGGSFGINTNTATKTDITGVPIYFTAKARNSGTASNPDDFVTLKELASAGSTTASNGLTKTGSDIKLGGELKQATIVNVAKQLYILGSTDSVNRNATYFQNQGAINIIGTKSTQSAQLGISGDAVELGYTDSNIKRSIRFNGSGMFAIDSIGGKGLVNGGDYEANFVARSLTTKQYVDAAVASSGGVPSSRQIANGYGILGGGDLSANRTLRVDTTVVASKPYVQAYTYTKAQANTNYFLATGESRNVNTSGILSGGNIVTGGTLRQGGGVLQTMVSLGASAAFTPNVGATALTGITGIEVATNDAANNRAALIVNPTDGFFGIGAASSSGTPGFKVKVNSSDLITLTPTVVTFPQFTTANAILGSSSSGVVSPITALPSGTTASTPTSGTQVSNKDYVDNAITTAGAGYVPNSRAVNSGVGLSGGGTLAADRTLAVDTAGVIVSKSFLGNYTYTKAQTNTAITNERSAVATLTNKTLTNAIVGTQTAGDNSTKAASTGYTDAAIITERSAAATLTNKTLTSPTLTTVKPASTFQTNTGVAGTDSIVVKNAGTLRAIAANTYTTPSDVSSAYVPNSRQVLSGTGMTGGGTLAADRTLNVDTAGIVAGKTYVQNYTYTKAQSDNTYVPFTGGALTGTLSSNSQITTTSNLIGSTIQTSTFNGNAQFPNTTTIATSALSQHQFLGSSNINYRAGFGGSSAGTLTSGANYTQVLFQSPATITSNGTNAYASTATFAPPVLSGAGFTNSQTVLITGAPSVGGTQSAFRVVAGASRLGGDLYYTPTTYSTGGVSYVVANTTSGRVEQVAATTMFPTVVVSSASTLTLAYGTDYVFSGSTGTFTLPAVNSTNNTRKDFITVKNRGTGNLTVSGTIYDGAAVSSITVAAGSAVTLLNDGTYFNRE